MLPWNSRLVDASLVQLKNELGSQVESEEKVRREGEPPMVQVQVDRCRRLLSLTLPGAKPTASQKWPGWPTQWPARKWKASSCQNIVERVTRVGEQRQALDLELCWFSVSAGLNGLFEP